MIDVAMREHPAMVTLGAGAPGPVRLSLAAQGAQFSLRCAAGDLSALEAASGWTLPERVGRIEVLQDAVRVLCLGPGEWLIDGPETAAATIVAGFGPAGAVAHALVDISDRALRIRMDGPLAAEAVAAGCPRDLRALLPGQGRRTLFDQAQVVLWRDGEQDFAMDVWRSFAPHVWSILTQVNAELASGV